jgi:cysteine desulfurase
MFNLGKNNRIYADYASITPTDPRVLHALREYYSKEYGNPSSLHKEGVAAKKALIEARKKCADLIKAHMDEIVFTGTGTEANNLAMFGVIEHLLESEKKPEELHVITSVIEHPSVLECVRDLAKRGVKVDYLGVDENGIINIKELKEKLRRETCLVSVMMVNNEIGTIEPIHDIARTVRHFKKHVGSAHVATNPRGEIDERVSYPLVHTDASQAFLYTDLSIEKLGVDLLTLDSHKVYGPKGVGMLFAKRGVRIAPQIVGGGQESCMRAGTENIPGIVGFAQALEIAHIEREKETARLATLRDMFIDELLKHHPQCVLNGSRTERIANNVNISIPDIDNEFFVLQLDAAGIACSTKSSCLRDENESYVIEALHHDKQRSASSIRFSFGRFTKKGDIAYILKVIDRILKK